MMGRTLQAWQWAVVILAGVLLLAHPCEAGTVYKWKYDVEGDWEEGPWDPPGIPGGDDTAIVDQGLVRILYNDDADAWLLAIGSQGGSIGRVLMDLNPIHTLKVYNAEDAMYVGDEGTGIFTQEGGTSVGTRA